MDKISYLEVLSKTSFELRTMAIKAREQHIINGHIFEALLQLVNEIKAIAQDNKSIPSELANRWNDLYGRIFRAFEGADVESSIDKITEIINSRKR